jgi:hypothetical protein
MKTENKWFQSNRNVVKTLKPVLCTSHDSVFSLKKENLPTRQLQMTDQFNATIGPPLLSLDSTFKRREKVYVKSDRISLNCFSWFNDAKRIQVRGTLFI